MIRLRVRLVGLLLAAMAIDAHSPAAQQVAPPGTTTPALSDPFSVIVGAVTPDDDSLLRELYLRTNEVRPFLLHVEAMSRPSNDAIAPVPVGSFDQGSLFDGWEDRGLPSPPGAFGRLDLLDRSPVTVKLLLGDAVLASQTLEPPADRVLFEVSVDDVLRRFGQVRLKLVSAETRQPIAGASMALNPWDSLVQLISSRTDTSSDIARTGEDGSLIVERASPGAVPLSIRAEGFEHYARSVHLEEGGILDLKTIELFPATLLRVRVIDAEGRIVAGLGLALRLAEDEPAPTPLSPPYRTHCGDDGVFEIADLGRRPYVAKVADGFQDDRRWPFPPSVECDLRKGDADVTLQLPHLTEIRIDLATPGPPVAALRLRAADGRTAVVDLRAEWRQRGSPRLMLEPGTYEAEWAAPAGSVRHRLEVGTDPIVVMPPRDVASPIEPAR